MRLSARVRQGTRFGLSLVGALLLMGCDDTIPGGTCAKDSDCPSGESCLVDLDRSVSYCARPCTSDRDCPRFQTCRISETGNGGMETLLNQICVDLNRECVEEERCNGLDDDCDGVVDGAGCTLVDRCLDDAPCGAWACQAPENQPVAVCAPPVDGGTTDYAECTADAECENGVCETGFCSEFCRPSGIDGCPGIFVDGMEFQTQCARSVGLASRPKHNKCQIECTTDSGCPNGLTCVWRDVFQGGDAHFFVCGIPDPVREPLGAACTNNQPDEGDDECQSGLCYGRTCTRSCGGPGRDCSDVGPDHRCQSVDLFYGELRIGAFICAEDP